MLLLGLFLSFPLSTIVARPFQRTLNHHTTISNLPPCKFVLFAFTTWKRKSSMREPQIKLLWSMNGFLPSMYMHCQGSSRPMCMGQHHIRKAILCHACAQTCVSLYTCPMPFLSRPFSLLWRIDQSIRHTAFFFICYLISLPWVFLTIQVHLSFHHWEEKVEEGDLSTRYWNAVEPNVWLIDSGEIKDERSSITSQVQ